MMETIVVLKPPTQWRGKARWYSDWPNFVKPVFRPFWPDTISWEELVNEMNAKLALPGQTNAWSMPIKNRIDMLTTGIRTPVGVKIFGSDLAEIEKIGQHLEGILQKIPGTRSVFGERVAGGAALAAISRGPDAPAARIGRGLARSLDGRRTGALPDQHPLPARDA